MYKLARKKAGLTVEEAVTLKGKHSLPLRLIALDPKDLEPNRSYTVSKVCELDVCLQET